MRRLVGRHIIGDGNRHYLASARRAQIDDPVGS